MALPYLFVKKFLNVFKYYRILLFNKDLADTLQMVVAMKDRSDTVVVGQEAPRFCLSAANQPGMFSLTEALGRGAAIAEFLRGTW